MRTLIVVVLCLLPQICFAVGDEEDFDPPTPTDTTDFCPEGQVWDRDTLGCVTPTETTNGRADLRRDVRALAYVGRYSDATALLDRMDARDPWVLTYRGFIARKRGDLLTAQKFYGAAIRSDPDNLLARSYMAQGFVAAGKIAAAQAQLIAIQRRGGNRTWPEVALRRALVSGVTSDY